MSEYDKSTTEISEGMVVPYCNKVMKTAASKSIDRLKNGDEKNQSIDQMLLGSKVQKDKFQECIQRLVKIAETMQQELDAQVADTTKKSYKNDPEVTVRRQAKIDVYKASLEKLIASDAALKAESDKTSDPKEKKVIFDKRQAGIKAQLAKTSNNIMDFIREFLYEKGLVTPENTVPGTDPFNNPNVNPFYNANGLTDEQFEKAFDVSHGAAPLGEWPATPTKQQREVHEEEHRAAKSGGAGNWGFYAGKGDWHSDYQLHGKGMTPEQYRKHMPPLKSTADRSATSRQGNWTGRDDRIPGVNRVKTILSIPKEVIERMFHIYANDDVFVSVIEDTNKMVEEETVTVDSKTGKPVVTKEMKPTRSIVIHSHNYTTTHNKEDVLHGLITKHVQSITVDTWIEEIDKKISDAASTHKKMEADLLALAKSSSEENKKAEIKQIYDLTITEGIQDAGIKAKLASVNGGKPCFKSVEITFKYSYTEPKAKTQQQVTEDVVPGVQQQAPSEFGKIAPQNSNDYVVQ
jgi:hypothetical protein